MSLNNTPYLFPHPQSNQLWFRRRVPRQLRPSIGRQEIRFSLQTSVLREAVQRCRMAANVVDRLFIEAEDRHESVKQALSARLQALQNDFNDPEALTAPLERWMIPTLADDPWPASDPADDKVNAAEFSGFDVRVDLPACGAGFHPYGAADAGQGAAFATERVLAVLDGQCTEATVWSWVRTKAFYDALPVSGQVPLRAIVPLDGSRYDSVMRTRDYRSVMGAP